MMWEAPTEDKRNEAESDRHCAGWKAAVQSRDARIATLEAEIAAAREDSARLDTLEALAADNQIGGLLIHHQIGEHVKWGGVGVGLSHRPLRKAIDAFRGKS